MKAIVLFVLLLLFLLLCVAVECYLLYCSLLGGIGTSLLSSSHQCDNAVYWRTIDSIITLMTVWRITGKIIRTTIILNYMCTHIMEFLQC